MKDKTLKDKNGVEIRESCVVRTKALSSDGQSYELFKVLRVHRKLSVQKRDGWGNPRIYGVAYILRWMKDESMEVVETPPE